MPTSPETISAELNDKLDSLFNRAYEAVAKYDAKRDILVTKAKYLAQQLDQHLKVQGNSDSPSDNSLLFACLESMSSEVSSQVNLLFLPGKDQLNKLIELQSKLPVEPVYQSELESTLNESEPQIQWMEQANKVMTELDPTASAWFQEGLSHLHESAPASQESTQNLFDALDLYEQCLFQGNRCETTHLHLRSKVGRLMDRLARMKQQTTDDDHTQILDRKIKEVENLMIQAQEKLEEFYETRVDLVDTTVRKLMLSAGQKYMMLCKDMNQFDVKGPAALYLKLAQRHSIEPIVDESIAALDSLQIENKLDHILQSARALTQQTSAQQPKTTSARDAIEAHAPMALHNLKAVAATRPTFPQTSNDVIASARTDRARAFAIRECNVINFQVNSLQLEAELIYVSFLEAELLGLIQQTGQLPLPPLEAPPALQNYREALEKHYRVSVKNHEDNIIRISEALDGKSLSVDQLSGYRIDLMNEGRALEKLKQDLRETRKNHQQLLHQATDRTLPEKKTLIIEGRAAIKVLDRAEQTLNELRAAFKDIEINLVEASNLLAIGPKQGVSGSFENAAHLEKWEQKRKTHIQACTQAFYQLKKLLATEDNNLKLPQRLAEVKEERKSLTQTVSQLKVPELDTLQNIQSKYQLSGLRASFDPTLKEKAAQAREFNRTSRALLYEFTKLSRLEAKTKAVKAENAAREKFQYTKPLNKAPKKAKSLAKPKPGKQDNVSAPNTEKTLDNDSASLSLNELIIKKTFLQNAEAHLEMAQHSCKALVKNDNEQVRTLAEDSLVQIGTLRSKLDRLTHQSSAQQAEYEEQVQKEIESLEEHIERIEQGDLQTFTAFLTNPKEALAVAPMVSKVTPKKKAIVPQNTKQQKKSEPQRGLANQAPVQIVPPSSGNLARTSSFTNSSSNSGHSVALAAVSPKPVAAQDLLPHTIGRVQRLDEQLNELTGLQRQLKRKLDQQKVPRTHPDWKPIRKANNLLVALDKDFYFEPHYIQNEFGQLEPTSCSESLRRLSWQSTQPGFDHIGAAHYLTNANIWLDHIDKGVDSVWRLTLEAKAHSLRP